MKRIQLLLSAALAITATWMLPAAEPGFESLFDGQTLGQWDGDPRFWRVEGGSIIGETTPENPSPGKRNTFLIYRGDSFDDFELRFRYKVEGYNSGVQYRSVDKGNYNVHGLQADFEAPWHEDGTLDRFSGMFFEEGGRMFMGQRGEVVIVRANETEPNKPRIEKVATLGDPRELAKAIKPNDWNEFIVIANGNQFTHIINGQVMCIGIDEDRLNFRKSGILAFQLHGGRPMKIEVKDARIRRIK
jgi:hypothetical protein